jgi:glycosyltransferase involved in cell wall biosynthesis
VNYIFNNNTDEFEHYLFCVENCALSEKNQHQKNKIFTYKKRFGADIFAAIKLKKISKKNKIDIIHLHDSNAINTYIIADVLGMNVPAIIHRHVNFPITSKYQYKKIQKIICVSNQVKSNFKDFIQEDKLEIIYPGIDVKKYENHKIENDKNLFTIGIVSALEPEKNIETFIEIANKITEKRNDVKFVIVGDGTLKKNFISQISALKSQINLLGFRNDIPQLLSTFDLFLFTSNNEGFGQVILEAMAAKVPVITSDFAVAKEIIDDKKTGYIYKDVDNAVSIIEELLANNNKRNMIKENAYNFVHNFDIKEMNEKVNNLYRKIILNS